MSQNVKQQLKPRLMMLLDEAKSACAQRRIIDLAKVDENAKGMSLHISKGLDKGTYGVDTACLVM